MNHTRIEMQAMDAQIQLTREIRKLREEMKVNTHAIVTAILAVADQRFTQEEASKVADDLMFDPPEPS